MRSVRPHVVLCNGATEARGDRTPRRSVLRLDYRPGRSSNVRISLPDFVQDVYHLPDRVLDLLEMASYVFAADRLVSRGSKAAVEYHGWARTFHFVIKVRDHPFWSGSGVREKLEAALQFMSGDRAYRFSFEPGHSTPPTSLFDSEAFRLEVGGPVAVVLFSGGLDSLTGVVDCLETSSSRLYLVSHESQPGTVRTQRQLHRAMADLYPGRTAHYKFKCTLHGVRAIDETQRTRAFLYTSIAYALACALRQERILVYENGVTAMNSPRRQDLMNARASRTAHPKTLALLQDLLSMISGRPFFVETPYIWKTKTDVVRRLLELGRGCLLSSTVSCSRTFQNFGTATHCGLCSQCVDRRFAVYAAGADDLDEVGIYSEDFILQRVKTGEDRMMLVDYVRQARDFFGAGIDRFYEERLHELTDIVEAFPDESEAEVVENVWRLCQRHGNEVVGAMRRMQAVHEHLYQKPPDGSFLRMVSEREYLKEPVEWFVEDVSRRLLVGIPLAFQRSRPSDEAQLNDQVSALLATEGERLEREHPAIRFALSCAVADHSSARYMVLIESKYVRRATTPSRITEGMAADLTKYGKDMHILFVVYDPDRKIADDGAFRQDFEAKGVCTVLIVR